MSRTTQQHIHAVAFGALELVASQPAVGFQLTSDRLNRLATFQTSPDASDTLTLLSREVNCSVGLKVTLAARILPVRIFQPANDQLLIVQLVQVFQIQHSHRQPSGFSWTAELGVIQLTKTIIEHGSVDQSRQPHQFMVHVDIWQSRWLRNSSLCSRFCGLGGFIFVLEIATQTTVNYTVSGNFKPGETTAIFNSNNDISPIIDYSGTTSGSGLSRLLEFFAEISHLRM